MVGGEQARNNELKQRQKQRKNLADQRKVHLIRALSEDSEDSESVLLNVYNSIQEEVHAKSQALVKVQGKVGPRGWRTSSPVCTDVQQPASGSKPHMQQCV